MTFTTSLYDTNNPEQWPIYDGALGVNLNAKSTTFTVWAPTAQSVTLRLFPTGNNSEPTEEYQLKPLRDGAWRINIRKRLDGIYYDYLVTFPNKTVNRTCDPWATASGINALRSLVVDIERINPSNWQDDHSPAFNKNASIVWETHVADFSSHPNGGFKPEHRGQYAAFTETNTTLACSNTATGKSAFPTGINYLKQLGVTHVQLEPIYDFATVDEAAIYNARNHTNDQPQDSINDLYNWGYDPKQYNVPEGVYSSNPHDGTTRIRECKSMIASLHSSGLRVIMDVVYNHMYEGATNAFEQMVPGYFCRRNEDGSLSNGSGCGNDMASERPMFRRFIIDSLVYWAKNYHIDGFRFDLMGLIDTQTLNLAREELDKLPGGRDILMYGEPWAAGTTAIAESIQMGDKVGRTTLHERIGWFSDETRDTIKGNVMDHHERGYVNGNEIWTHEGIRNALNGWRGTESSGREVGQIIQYVSAHDDLTLWDKLCISMRQQPTEAEFAALAQPHEMADIMSANMLAAGITLCSAGIPFMLSGEEFARTKLGCSNSYRSGVMINQLDWSRAQQFEPLVRWYSALIALRRAWPEFYDGVRTQLPTSHEAAIATLIGENLILCINPMYHDVTIELPSASQDTNATPCTTWHCELDSTSYLAAWLRQAPEDSVHIEYTDRNTAIARLPKRTFAILRK